MSPGGKVYVIDDDAAMRDSLDFLLGSAGFSVRLFDSAPAFLDELPNLAFGCVVTDIRMPDTIPGSHAYRALQLTDHQHRFIKAPPRSVPPTKTLPEGSKAMHLTISLFAPPKRLDQM